MAIKILKRILTVLITVILLLLVVVIFTKKEYEVEREIIINKPKQEVFDFVKHLKNQVFYNPWVMKYPSEKMEYLGTDGVPGFKHVWDSPIPEVGQGEEWISKIQYGKRMEIELHFVRPIDRWAIGWMTTDSLGQNQTRLKWGFSGSIRYPLNGILLFIDLEKRLGDQLATGLVNIKNHLETKN